tara:strand:+ start:308 stop:484 length:177 start_codon:yes stop_codon:yes gene_type:complete
MFNKNCFNVISDVIKDSTKLKTSMSSDPNLPLKNKKEIITMMKKYKDLFCSLFIIGFL